MTNLNEWIQTMRNMPEDCVKSSAHNYSDYELGDSLGSGTEYAVFKVKKKGDRNTYDMRILRKAYECRKLLDMCIPIVIDKRDREEFCEEMEIWDKAHSACPEGVAELLDCNVSPFPWCVTEHGEKNLQEELDSGESMRLEDFCSLMVNLLTKLGKLHRDSEPPIVHRDIKPENIILVNNEWKFIDFGIAGYDKRMRKDSTIQGSCDYMSPEEAKGPDKDGKLYYQSSSDIWAMGMILYKFVTGVKDPYPGATNVTILNEIVRGPAGLRPGSEQELSKTLGPIIKKALALNPNDRYASAFDFADALRNIQVSDCFRDAIDAYSGRVGPEMFIEPDYKKAYEICLAGEAESLECKILECIIVGESSYVPESISADDAFYTADLMYSHLIRRIPPDFFEETDGDIQWMGGRVKELGLGLPKPDMTAAEDLYLKSSMKGSVLGSFALYQIDSIRYAKLKIRCAKIGFIPAKTENRK